MTDHAPLLERLFDLVPAETHDAILDVEGELPAFVRGEYLVNGPAQFRRGDLRYRNWLDGDGMVLALRLGEGPPRLTARYVLGDRRRAELGAGRPVFRAFGTAFPGDRLLRGVGLASPVNVSVLRFAGAILAFGEQGLPHALDPDDLATRGIHDFGALTPITPFSAHPAIDPATGDLCNFGVSFARERPLLHYFRISPRHGLVLRERVALPYPASVHDFSLTSRHAVFHLAPHLLDVEPLLSAGASVLDCLTWRPELGARLLVLDACTGAQRAAIPIGHGYCLHHVGAFDDGDRLVVDLLELDEPLYPDYQGLPDLFVAVKPARVVRLVVDPQRGELLARDVIAPGLAIDFPNPDPRHRRRDGEFWALAISATGRPGRKFFDRLIQFDWRAGGITGVYTSPAARYLGAEPVFIPSGPGREGVVICQEFDAARSESAFLVFDAHALARGPIARLRAPTPVHLGFHAVFTPRLILTAPPPAQMSEGPGRSPPPAPA